MSSPILVGRESEMRAFEVALEEARDGRPAVIVLGGEAGVGKTRLIAEFGARTREVGGTAVVGSATPSVGASRTPFAALMPVLRGLVRSFDARLIDRMLGDARRDLAALLPELGPPARAPDDTEPFAAARLSEAVLVALEAAARLRPPLLVAFDDMHWADDATRDIVTYVSRNLVDVGVVTLVTYRSDAVHGHEPTIAFIAELTRVSGAEHLDLGPLSPDDVSRQVRAILGADPAAEIMHALVRRSSGNPFFVEELVASVVQGGVERLPPSVRTMVEARMARLSPAARTLVEVAALGVSEMPALAADRLATEPLRG
jgi:predicted ATPase